MTTGNDQLTVNKYIWAIRYF